MRKAILLILTVLVLSLICGCQSVSIPNEPPDIQVVTGDEEINWGWTILKWNNQEQKTVDSFNDFISSDSINEATMTKVGNVVEVSFSDNPPEKLTVTESWIDEYGRPIYLDNNTIEIPVDLQNGKCSFHISEHPASGLISSSKGNITAIRGYRMTAIWHENICQYVFIIKTESYEGVTATNSEMLTVEKVIELSKQKNDLSWDDFTIYTGTEIGSGLYIMSYPINDTFSLLVGGGSPDDKPMYILLKAIDANNEDHSIDIRENDVEEFIKTVK